MRIGRFVRATLIGSAITTALVFSLNPSSAQLGGTAGVQLGTTTGGTQQRALPKELDVRGPEGVPKGTLLRAPTAAQLAAVGALQSSLGSKLSIQYNGLTATPRHLFSHGSYLTRPSTLAPEQVARDFLSRHRAIFRFGEADLRELRLKSRARLPEGTTVLLFEQTRRGLPVYNGGVLVNVNRVGQIISVGGESFPNVQVTNAAGLTPEEPLAAGFAVTPEQAIANAAADLGVAGFTPRHAGARQVPTNFGDLPREYVSAPKFAGGGVFTDDITVTKTVFPLGDQARLAYRFVLTTPQFHGIMWENIVDAQTGKLLRRISLTSFQAGGGHGAGRRGTFRPDVQDLVESFSTAPTAAQGKVTDTAPTALSGYRDFGRSPARGTAPTYASESAGPADRLNGRGFKFSQVDRRHENPLIYNTGFGQVLRGLPDALNPTPASPFGWFYLPTNNDGSEITVANTERATTKDYGYSISAEAKTRNAANGAANSPTGDGSQPFSADLTPLGAGVELADGRTLNSVFQSRYTEGNNVLVADDISNDNETTHGIKGYASDRKYTASYFDYINSYEYGGVNGINPTSHPDVFPGTVTLFYYNNLIHDYLYSIGFTEATWNFQQDNFGKGGEGGDGLSAQVQDGSGTNNANFSTQADGTAPRMQMYLFTSDVFRKSDGDFDFDVVAHEYYHGVSNRSAAKGSSGCLGVAFFGESGGMGEGWGDTIAASMTDDDVVGEFATGEHDKGIRAIPMTNFRWSYGAIDGRKLNRRDQATPDPANPPGVSTGVPPVVPAFQVHFVGTIFSGITWDVRELLIMKQKVNNTFPGVFFDGMRRAGSGAPFYIGERLVQSIDTRHPIDYRESFGTHALVTPTPAPVGTVSTNILPSVVPAYNAQDHIVRPRMVADEIAAGGGQRNGPLATAVARGARLADTLILRGIQLAPCNPSFVDMRDAILLADKELTGGENRAVIWRAFASHGVGALAASSHSGAATDPASSMAPVVVEDFSVPTTVATCEQLGPLAAPAFTLSNTTANTVTVTITPAAGAARYIVSRSDDADGPFQLVAETTSTTVQDNNGGAGLEKNRTYFYQVRASRDAESNCVSAANTQSILVTLGLDIDPTPLFAGVDRVDDPQDGSRLIVSWKPATSINPTAKIVYDLYRVTEATHGDGTQEPTFTPDPSNRIAQGLTGTSYNDLGLTLAQPYYYIVQARDTDNGKLDTNDAGNRVTRFNAPTVSAVTAPVFPVATFETSADSARFTLPLTESGSNPNQNSQSFQRVTGANQSGIGLTDGKMYAPDFSPGDEAGLPDPVGTHHGAASDFSVMIGGPGGLTLTRTSILEFDNFINSEAFFDGGVLEARVGAPFSTTPQASDPGSTPYPDNTATFDLGNYIIEGGYNARLDGQLEGVVRGSPLQGRRAYTGNKSLHHVRVTLAHFAPGALHNPQSLPVYIRFRMTSDVASANGLDSGWYVDNVVINNLACRANVAGTANGATATASSSATERNYTPAGAIDGDRRGFDWENGGGWNDNTRDLWPDWLEVAFNGSQTVNEVRVYTLQNNYRSAVEPTPDMTAEYYGIRDFDVQYWNGSAWVTVPGGAIRDNDRVMRTVTFPDVTTDRIRINVLAGRSSYSRIVEVEAFGCASQ